MTELVSIPVEIPGGFSYPIITGASLRRVVKSHDIASLIAEKSVLVLSDASVSALYLSDVLSLLGEQCPYKLESFVINPGESSKTLLTVSAIYDFLLVQDYDRNAVIVALGGGIVGDIAGFVSASFMRGVDFIQIPTTLLAQVDSSVGGKTGVNHPKGKNLIGAFKQPKAVLIATNFLQSLPQREVSAGIAEILKYGLIYDQDFYHWLDEQKLELKTLNPAVMQQAIMRSCQIKADVVAKDEKELGVRAILNFGHTFGHAIERVLGYGQWLHGEAVAVGMLMAMSLSQRMGYLGGVEVERLKRILTVAGLPTMLPESIDVESLLSAMWNDKKVLSGKQRFVVLSAIGSAIIIADPPLEMVRSSISEFQPIS